MIRKKTSSCLEDEGILLLHIVPTVSPSPHRHFCLHCCRNAVGHFSRALPFPPPPPPLHFKDAARRLSSQTVCQRAPLCHPAALITHSLGESPNHLCCYRSGAEGSAQMGAAVICPRPPQSSHTEVLNTLSPQTRLFASQVLFFFFSSSSSPSCLPSHFLSFPDTCAYGDIRSRQHTIVISIHGWLPGMQLIFHFLSLSLPL